MATKSIKVTDLRAATEASIKAVLGRQFIRRPGILVGLWIDKTAIAKLGIGPGKIANDIAREVSAAAGIRLIPGVRPGKGGVLVGYIQPKIRA